MLMQQLPLMQLAQAEGAVGCAPILGFAAAHEFGAEERRRGVVRHRKRPRHHGERADVEAVETVGGRVGEAVEERRRRVQRDGVAVGDIGDVERLELAFAGGGGRRPDDGLEELRRGVPRLREGPRQDTELMRLESRQLILSVL